MKSGNWNALPTLIFVLIILYHNSSFYATMVISQQYRNAIRMSNIGSTRSLFPHLSYSEGFALKPGMSLVRYYQEQVRNILQNDGIWNFGHFVFASRGRNGNGNEDKGDDKGDDKGNDKGDDKSDDKGDDINGNRKEEEKDEKKESEERNQSRIPTYDEYARFRDSSRPPDSHYPPGPGPGYRRSGSYNLRTNLYFCVFVISVSHFRL